MSSWHGVASNIVLAGASIATVGLSLRAARKTIISIIRVHAAVDAIHDLVEFQLKPNGGSSIVDKLDRIEALVKSHEARLVSIERRQTAS